jgi:hypothetical protein
VKTEVRLVVVAATAETTISLAATKYLA